jgi:hypothetical protein
VRCVWRPGSGKESDGSAVRSRWSPKDRHGDRMVEVHGVARSAMILGRSNIILSNILSFSVHSLIYIPLSIYMVASQQAGRSKQTTSTYSRSA